MLLHRKKGSSLIVRALKYVNVINEDENGPEPCTVDTALVSHSHNWRMYTAAQQIQIRSA